MLPLIRSRSSRFVSSIGAATSSVTWLGTPFSNSRRTVTAEQI
jgi:cation transporter-like permease